MSDNFIYSQNKTKNSHDPSSKFYTLKGNEDFIDYENNPRQNKEDLTTQAKALSRSNGSIHYYIKVSGNGKPHNPVDNYLNIKTATMLKAIGKDIAQFHEVNHRVFNMYLSFLRTKNTSWLHNTEREMI
jgi:hypothetical protein